VGQADARDGSAVQEAGVRDDASGPDATLGSDATTRPRDGAADAPNDGGAAASPLDSSPDGGCTGPAPDPTLLSDVVHIAVGNGFACAVRGAGSVVCWGQYFRGQLGFTPDGGVGHRMTDFQTRPTPVPGLANVTAIALGDSHACAIDASQHVWCWGWNSEGQLGNGEISPTNGTSSSAVDTVNVDWNPAAALVESKSGGQLARVEAIAAGTDHSCAFVQGGVVACWGNNDQGQLGQPAEAGALAMTAVPSAVALGGAVSLSAGLGCTCAVIHGTPSTVECVGSNASGQLGATPPGFGVPVAMTLPSSATTPAVVTGSSYLSPHTVVLDVAGNSFGAGDNDGGALGAFANAQPAAIPGLSSGNVVAVTTGPTHTCAILSDGGNVECIGTNGGGQLGRGFVSPAENDPDYVEAPAAAGAPDVDASDGTRLGNVFEIAVGYQTSCAIVRNACRTDGTAYCWGSNYVGQVGDGTTTPHHRPVGVVAH
jgi:alpha-tubulin suppressor-like RCC1 family protein